MPLAGKPVLEHVIRRCRHAQTVDRVIVATTIEPQDLAVVNFVSGLGVGVFCGAVNDVLDRYYQTARLFAASHIVRITADCPAIDPAVIDRVVEKYFASGADYASNGLEVSFPDGEDVEVFSFEAISRAWHEAKMASEREHVTPYLYKTQFFKKVNLRHEADWGHCRWTLDEEQDYRKLSAVFEALYPGNEVFNMEAIMRFLEAHPEIDALNAAISRNEGYKKSLTNDRKVL